MHFSHLFQEGKIGTCVLRNRLIMSLYPAKYSADSRANNRMIEFYRERARGGVAMIVLDCPCLDFPKAYKGPNELRFDTPEFAGGIRTLLNTIHLEGRSSFDFGTNIVILGSGDIGCETADLLSSQAKNITIVEMCEEPLRRMKEIPKEELLKRLKEKGVTIAVTCKAIKIEKGKVIIYNKNGLKQELKADSVIIAVGSIPDNSLYHALKDSVKEIYLVGDAKEPGNLGAALRSATEVGLKI